MQQAAATGERENSARAKQVFRPEEHERPDMSLEEIVEAKESFDLYDETLCGKIDVRSTKGRLAAVGLEGREHILLDFFAKVDAEGVTQLDFQEYLKRLADEARPSARKVFAYFDEEKTNFLSVKSLGKTALAIGQVYSQEELEAMVAAADLDKDGLLSFDEFLNVLPEKYAQK